MGDATIYILLDSSLIDEAAAPIPPVSSSIQPPSSSSNESSPTQLFQFQSTSHVISADASLAELMTVILSKLASNNNDNGDDDAIMEQRSKHLDRLTVLDVSYNPAKVISSIVRQYTEVSGPNSKTLHSLGWYPSGKLVVLPAPTTSLTSEKQFEEDLLNRFLQWQSRNVLQHEEFAYNNPDAAKVISGNSPQLGDNSLAATKSANSVQWTGVGASSTTSTTATLKPSEIFNAVEQRIINDDDEQSKLKKATTTKRNNKPKRTERERTQRLDALLQNLQSKKSNDKKKKKKAAAVSEKVRTMLIKSRSEGNKKLRMEDRFHLEVIKLWDVDDGSNDNKAAENDDSGSSYRFFSRQTTAGRVASTMAPNLGNARACELLVSYPSPSSSSASTASQEKCYRRLPNTMSLHDASKWVKDFDVVVVRIYSLAGCCEGDGHLYGPSKSVLDPDKDDSDDEIDDENGEDEDNNIGQKEQQHTASGDIGKDSAIDIDITDNLDNTEESQQAKEQSQQQQLQERIHTMFQCSSENDGNNNNKPTRKKKKVSKQVQSMLIKSKSTGNERVKQEDRIYLQVILFHDDGSTDDVASASAYSSTYRFFSKQNDVQHIITVCNNGSSGKAVSKNVDGEVLVEFIVPQPSNNDGTTDLEPLYCDLSSDLTLGDAIQKGYVENFGKVLIRVCTGTARALSPWTGH